MGHGFHSYVKLPEGTQIAWVYKGKSQSEMDDGQGYPHEFGNLHGVHCLLTSQEGQSMLPSPVACPAKDGAR